MTISNSQFVRDALGLIGVLGEIEPASPEQATHGLRIFNEVMASWIEDGIDLQYYEQDDPSADCPLPPGFTAAAKYQLSFSLAPYYGKQVSPEMIAEGQRLYNTLVRNTVKDQLKPIKSNLPAGDGDRYRTRSILLG